MIHLKKKTKNKHETKKQNKKKQTKPKSPNTIKVEERGESSVGVKVKDVKRSRE